MGISNEDSRPRTPGRYSKGKVLKAGFLRKGAGRGVWPHEEWPGARSGRGTCDRFATLAVRGAAAGVRPGIPPPCVIARTTSRATVRLLPLPSLASPTPSVGANGANAKGARAMERRPVLAARSPCSRDALDGPEVSRKREVNTRGEASPARRMPGIRPPTVRPPVRGPAAPVGSTAGARPPPRATGRPRAGTGGAPGAAGKEGAIVGGGPCGFRTIPIAHSIPFRSLIPRETDRSFHGISIADFHGNRSVIPGDSDHPLVERAAVLENLM